MNDGLEGVVAAKTVLSDVRGEAGELIIRGYPLAELAGRKSFEQVVHLLFDGFFEDLADEQAFTHALASARCAVFESIRPALSLVAHLPIYDGVRALATMQPDGDELDDALCLLALPAVALPMLIRNAAKQKIIAPSQQIGHAEDIVRMLGKDRGAAALDAYLVSVSDHGLNASTFATRVVASTQAGLTSSVLAGYCALKGPLHGGAPGPVIEMLDAIAEVGDGAGWIERSLNRGDRLMGFGHRIYRTRDPRADVLKEQVRALSKEGTRLSFAEEVEQLALSALRRRKPDRVIETNVEYYTALLLEAVGFPPECFTAVFATGRTAGWLAHAREQAVTGRVIRPSSIYVPPAERMVA
jgi:citrate synthase